MKKIKMKKKRQGPSTEKLTADFRGGSLFGLGDSPSSRSTMNPASLSWVNNKREKLPSWQSTQWYACLVCLLHLKSRYHQKHLQSDSSGIDPLLCLNSTCFTLITDISVKLAKLADCKIIAKKCTISEDKKIWMHLTINQINLRAG